MSLDIYLYGEEVTEEAICQHCGSKYTEVYRELHFTANITHNLSRMAEEAGIYDCLWDPQKAGIEVASQISPMLASAIKLMEADPAHFKKFDSDNGWGTYDQFVPWLKELLEACQEYPDATIEVSR